MNVFILTDLEGIAGVTDIDYMDRQGEKYRDARRYLTESLNRTAEICRDCGAENIWYLDGHGGGGNVYAEEVVGTCVGVDLAGWQKLIREGQIDCQIEIGGHARAGTAGGFLDHTLNSKQFFSYKVNGIEASELYLHAAFLGFYDVPIVFFSGDDVACNLAYEAVPGICCAPIKSAKQRNVCVMRENADEIFEDMLRRALAHYDKVAPLKISSPVEPELTYYRTDFCEGAMSRLASMGKTVVDAEQYHGEYDVIVRKDARTLTKKLRKIESYDDLRF